MIAREIVRACVRACLCGALAVRIHERCLCAYVNTRTHAFVIVNACMSMPDLFIGCTYSSEQTKLRHNQSATYQTVLRKNESSRDGIGVTGDFERAGMNSR